MWKFIKVAIFLALMYIGASCSASRHFNDHLQNCINDVNTQHETNNIKRIEKAEIENELRECVQQKMGFPESIFARNEPITVSFQVNSPD